MNESIKYILKKFCYFIKKNLLELIVIFSFSIFLVLNIKNIMWFSFISNNTNNLFVLNTVIISVTLTFLAFVLNINKEDLYSVERQKLRSLPGIIKYSIFKMFFFFITMLCLFSIFIFIELYLCSVLLTLYICIYAFLFVWQEIPFIIYDRKKISHKISKTLYYYHCNCDENKKLLQENYDDDLYKIIDRIILDIILNKNIYFTYNFLNYKKKYTKSLTLILERLSNYLIDVNKIKIENKKIPVNLDGKLFKIIEKIFENLRFILIPSMTIDLLQIVQSDNADIGLRDFEYRVINIFFSLKKILHSYSRDDMFDSEFKKLTLLMFSQIAYNKEINYSNVYYNLLNKLTMYTMSNEEIWFSKILTNSIGNCFYSKELYSYQFFFLCYCNQFFSIESKLEKKFKEEILCMLINSNSNGFNENILDMIFRNVSELSIFDQIILLKNVLSIYKLNTNGSWFDLSRFGSGVFSLENSFDSTFLIDCWLMIVLTSRQSRYSSISQLDFENHLNIHLSDDIVQITNRIFDKWINIDGFKKFDSDFLKRFDLFTHTKYLSKFNLSKSISLNTNYITLFQKFVLKTKKENLQSKIYNQSYQEDNFDKQLKMIENNFNDSIKKIDVLDSIDLSEEKLYSYRLNISTIDMDSLISYFTDNFFDEFTKIISKELDTKTLQFTSNIYDEYNEEAIDKIKSLNPILKYSYKMLNELNIESINCINSFNDYYFAKSALSVNFEYNSKLSNIRRFNVDEINSIIDKEYKMENGLYCYYEYANSKCPIHLSKEEIFNILNISQVYCEIVFKYKIIIDKDKIICIKNK